MIFRRKEDPPPEGRDRLAEIVERYLAHSDLPTRRIVTAVLLNFTQNPLRGDLFPGLEGVVHYFFSENVIHPVIRNINHTNILFILLL